MAKRERHRPLNVVSPVATHLPPSLCLEPACQQGTSASSHDPDAAGSRLPEVPEQEAIPSTAGTAAPRVTGSQRPRRWFNSGTVCLSRLVPQLTGCRGLHAAVDKATRLRVRNERQGGSRSNSETRHVSPEPPDSGQSEPPFPLEQSQTRQSR